MRIGVLGPSDVDKWKEIINISDDFLDSILNNIVDSIVGLEHEIQIVPTRKSIPYDIAMKYKDKDGKKIFGVIPLDDTEFGIDELDEFFADEVINCVTWRNQPEKFCEESDVLLVIGFSPGTLIEVMQSKWFGKNKVLVIEELISSKLPKESIDKLDVKYIKYDELEQHLLENKDDQ